jgi:hypothetical protein
MKMTLPLIKKETTQLKLEILILQKVCHKSKMLIGFGILVMRRFMTQISKKAISCKSSLNVNYSTVRLSQKGMTYDTLFAWFFLVHKGAFLRLPLLDAPNIRITIPYDLES